MLQGLVLNLDALDLGLQSCHLSLPLIEYCRHLGKLPAFIFLHLLDAIVDRELAIIELLVLLLEVDKAATQTLNAHVAVIVEVLVVRHNFVEELRVLLQLLKLLLPRVQLQALPVDALLQLFDGGLVISGRLG